MDAPCGVCSSTVVTKMRCISCQNTWWCCPYHPLQTCVQHSQQSSALGMGQSNASGDVAMTEMFSNAQNLVFLGGQINSVHGGQYNTDNSRSDLIEGRTNSMGGDNYVYGNILNIQNPVLSSQDPGFPSSFQLPQPSPHSVLTVPHIPHQINSYCSCRASQGFPSSPSYGIASTCSSSSFGGLNTRMEDYLLSQPQPPQLLHRAPPLSTRSRRGATSTAHSCRSPAESSVVHGSTDPPSITTPPFLPNSTPFILKSNNLFYHDDIVKY